MDTFTTELSDVLGQYVPYDGPHSRETVLDAARSISALVRYINNATSPGRTTLAWAHTVCSTTSSLCAAVHGMDQLFDQLTTAIEREDPTRYYDGDHRNRELARVKSAEAARYLETARMSAATLAQRLSDACTVLGTLGND
ncbi:hypothetical protein [Amycolatopsis alkalitolerans]|uniref:Uncharacterized protein n=1 Tax=Amycolatopsis alkalitolerans TaxID=2547244 RepID=A0A5C4LS41_9PSEU|nr:hypothetical protein [Amycolatopsis alkalitolerans]TNC19078.1 hypothetical protein FG385_32960 [Amycolatopsis alkalitolerans]